MHQYVLKIHSATESNYSKNQLLNATIIGLAYCALASIPAKAF